MTIAEATILIVDDEPDLLEIFGIWLGRSVCTILRAPNGAEALKVLATQRVDAMISDIRMPIIDGMMLVRRIYEMEIVLPSIIFVSGFGDLDVREAYALGVEFMLPKPLSRQDLLQSLATSLEDRENLWLTPMQKTGERIISMEFPSLEHALEEGSFAIGRGGCSFIHAAALPEGAAEIEVCFAEEDLSLRAQGFVRWNNPNDQCAGFEFAYLAPESRGWVIPKMRGGRVLSYIPHC